MNLKGTNERGLRRRPLEGRSSVALKAWYYGREWCGRLNSVKKVSEKAVTTEPKDVTFLGCVGSIVQGEGFVVSLNLVSRSDAVLWPLCRGWLLAASSRLSQFTSSAYGSLCYLTTSTARVSLGKVLEFRFFDRADWDLR